MAERKKYDPGLVAVGKLLREKRRALGPDYQVRQDFIDLRSDELFGGAEWISLRHLVNLELGKNWISIEKLVILAAALEEDSEDLFIEIISTYNQNK